MMIDNLTILLVGQLQTKPENLFILQLQYTEVNSVGISPHKKVWLTASCSLREKKQKRKCTKNSVFISEFYLLVSKNWMSIHRCT